MAAEPSRQRLETALRTLLRQAGALLAALGRLLAAAVRVGWPPLRGAIRALATAILALILVFEEWGWRPLADLVALLARFRLWARIEGFIAGLPPYGALAAFVLPSALLLPVKLLALLLLAKGQAILAGLMIVGAKLAGTAFVARIFLLTKPALMRIGWFARLYDWFVPWNEALLAKVRASWAWRYGRILKARVQRDARAAWRAAAPAITAVREQARARGRMIWRQTRAALAMWTRDRRRAP